MASYNNIIDPNNVRGARYGDPLAPAREGPEFAFDPLAERRLSKFPFLGTIGEI
jgi:hypothetical protein